MMHRNIHRPLVMGCDWMITADHPLAAQAGAAILEAGGNAVDAAIAANLVLAVVRPHMCGPGGDLFALVYWAADGCAHALNASGCAPAAATSEYFRCRGYDQVPEKGILSATVPGAVHGWQALIDRFASRPWDYLAARAIHYAAAGFPVYGELLSALRNNQTALLASPAAAQTLLPGGCLPKIGERLVQPQLAQSLRKIGRLGADVFYRGELGRRIGAYSHNNGGLITDEDLAGQRVEWVEPLETDYRGYSLLTLPPNSQGIALLMQANMLEKVDVSALDGEGAELIHRMVETKKLAFADRDRYVCDPRHRAVPVKQMLDKAYAARQMNRIDLCRAAERIAASDFTRGGDDTVYLAVVDRLGNAVSMIQSLFEAFGSCVMVPETGILLHNRGRGFSLDPQHPNCLSPGKRPYHTLHPAMVLKARRPCFLLGSPGADGQTQTVMQLLVQLLDQGANVQEAVEAPRWRSYPDGALQVEGRFSAETLTALERLGHRVEARPAWDEVMGSAQAIRLDHEQGVLSGGADPRRQAYAITG
jgi:gamma-glutamyltranspeptidase / glutathione hydrolase